MGSQRDEEDAVGDQRLGMIFICLSHIEGIVPQTPPPACLPQARDPRV